MVEDAPNADSRWLIADAMALELAGEGMAGVRNLLGNWFGGKRQDAWAGMQQGLPDRVYEGLLLLSDISGYTRFLASTELEHARYIIGTLLRSLVESTRTPLEVSKLEGDAVFVFTGTTEALDHGALWDQIGMLLGAFARAQAELDRKLECPCGACANVPTLGLKFIVHRGSYVLLPVGPFQELLGIDVVVAHRLLKNSVPLRDYALFTQAVLDADPRLQTLPGLAPITEAYDDVGAVAGAYVDLTEERMRLLQAAR